METNLLLTLFVASAVLSAATFAACHWWYGRKLAAAAERLEKSEKARQFSAQQTLQARKQIEKLQRELASLQRARAEAEAAQAQPPPPPPRARTASCSPRSARHAAGPATAHPPRPPWAR